MSQDIFVEVGHGPTLIDHNLLLSEVSLRMATEGLALVHNLICGSFTAVGAACDSIVEGKLRQRYTPYHIPHRTEVMGFMTILHGDDRFYNNIFVQRWPSEDATVRSDSEDKIMTENREVGTHVFNEYVTYDEWIKYFDMENDTPDMKGLEPYHYRPLPVWVDGNAYFAGAASYKNEKHNLVDTEHEIQVELTEEDGHMVLHTNVYDFMKEFEVSLISSDTLGKAFEPEERFENPDGSEIVFRTDYLGSQRDTSVIPGPFAKAVTSQVVY